MPEIARPKVMGVMDFRLPGESFRIEEHVTSVRILRRGDRDQRSAIA
jgi:hypothetical protein